MGIWVSEYMGIWVYGYMRMWVYGYMGIWVYGHMGIWLFGASGGLLLVRGIIHVLQHRARDGRAHVRADEVD